MSTVIENLQNQLAQLAEKHRTPILQGFFKTSKGQYAEGDVFIGVSVPNQRKVAKIFTAGAKIKDLAELLDSPIHEHRLTALLIMTYQWTKARKKGDKDTLKALHALYLKKTNRINNWDLVDTSAPAIVGEYLLDNPEKLPLLDKLIVSKDLWERRIALLASFAFIKEGDTKLITKLASQVLTDKHDLIHKASGWMLREMGKRASVQDLLTFLDTYAQRMPRTMLRYAIEKLTPDQKAKYMRQ